MPAGFEELLGATNVPINAPVSGLKRSTAPVLPSATYRFPSGPMASPSEETTPPVKVSFCAPVYQLYEDAWLELGLPYPLLIKISARAAGAQRPDIHSAKMASPRFGWRTACRAVPLPVPLSKSDSFRCCDMFMPS